LDALLNEAREKIIQQEAERAELNALLQKKREYTPLFMDRYIISCSFLFLLIFF
jgi:hypothetical protein